MIRGNPVANGASESARSWWKRMATMSNTVKLWEVPRYSRVRIDGVEFEFDHIDGAYSYCTLDDGTVCHLACWSDVEVVRSGRDGTAKNGED